MDLLILTDREFPCNESFLRDVYSIRFPEHGHRVGFVMYSDKYSPGRYTWNECPVYILSHNSYKYSKAAINYVARRLNPIKWVINDFGIPDVIQVRNDLSMGLYAINISDVYDIPFIYRISHLKPETVGLRGQYDNKVETCQGSIKCVIGRKVRRIILNESDKIFTISEEMSDYFSDYINTFEAPMGVDTRTSPSPAIDKFRKLFGGFNGLTLVYLGTISKTRNPEFMINILRILSNKINNISLLIIGGESERKRALRDYAKKVGVEENLLITGWIDDQSLISAGLHISDVGISPLPVNEVYRCSSPTKVLEYFFHELPVVCTPIPDQRDLVEESGGGLIAQPQLMPFVSAIRSILDSRNLENMGKKGKEYIIENRSYDDIFKKIIQHYPIQESLE